MKRTIVYLFLTLALLASLALMLVPASPAFALSSDAHLITLTISDGTLQPTPFDPLTHNYTDAVANSVSSVTVTPTAVDPLATIDVNGVTVASGSTSGAINLNVGDNTITINVTSSDASASMSYYIVVTRAPGPDATLFDLTISSGPLTPAFASATHVYTQGLANIVSSVTVTPTANDPNYSSITVNGAAVVSGTASGPINLSVGANTITIAVIAQDKTTTINYVITVTRFASDATLSALTISPPGALVPTFDPATTSYTASVPSSATSVRVTPTANDPNYSSITVNGTTVVSGGASGPINVHFGSGNTINIVVAAQDNHYTKTYTVNVTRQLSSDATLSGLTISAGTLTPAFASGTTSYADSVANSVSSVTVTPTATDSSHAIITVNGATVASGSASLPINLNVNDTTITILVIAQDKTTTATYTVTVTRAGPSSIDIGDPATKRATYAPSAGYTRIDFGNPANADGIINQVQVYFNTAATGVKVGTFSASVPGKFTVRDQATIGNVAAGATRTFTGLNIQVKAGDYIGIYFATGRISRDNTGGSGVYYVLGDKFAGGENIYTFAAGQRYSLYGTGYFGTPPTKSSDAALKALTISDGTLTPAFDSGTFTYTDDVASSVSFVTVTPTVRESHATIKVNGTAVASGTASGPISLSAGVPKAITILVTAQDTTIKDTYTVTVTRAGPPPVQTPIDIGDAATKRATYAPSSGYTRIDFGNPANADGHIDTVSVYFVTAATGVKIGTFSSSASGKFTVRDQANIGNVAAGSVQTYAVNIQVMKGDHIGIYFDTGQISRDNTGGSGVYYVLGDKFPGGENTYTLAAGQRYSLYGTGIGP